MGFNRKSFSAACKSQNGKARLSALEIQLIFSLLT
jgi:hypothetical protein